jgi:sn-glycerol 3-phosphate transport system substrate-binding protein
MKTLNRRKFLKGVGLGAGAAALAACASPTPTAAPKPAEAKPAAPAVVTQPGSTVTIVHWGFSGGNLEKREKELADKFNAMQKDVKVDMQVQGSYEETANKLTASLAAKQAPDMVLLSDVWWFKFVRAKALQNLNDVVAAEKGIDPKDFIDSLWNEGARKGAQYWIPFARSTPLFYYNKDMFKAAGIDKAPATWQEVADIAPKFVKKDGDAIKVAGFVHPDDSNSSYVAWLFQCVAWAFGGGYSNADLSKFMLLEPDTIRAAQFYQDSVNKAKWAMPSKDVQKDFISGLTAMAMMSTGSLAGTLADAKFDVGTAFLPSDKTFGCCTGGSGLAIPITTPKEKAQAAMKYIAYATGNEGGAFWSQNSGYVPVRKSTAETQSYKDFFAKNPQYKTAVEQLPKTRPQDAARNFIPGGDNIIGKGLGRIIIGKEDVATVWKDITAQLEKEAEPVKKDIAALG